MFGCRVFRVAKIPPDTVVRRRFSSPFLVGEDSDGGLEVVWNFIEPVHAVAS